MKKGDLKECTNCGEEKPATTEYFRISPHKRKSGDRVLRGTCHDCQKEYYKKWSKENPDKLRASQIRYRKNSKEKYREKQARYKRNNLEKHRNLNRINSIKYYNKNKQSPSWRLVHCMRSGLYKCLSGKQKTSHTMEYVGMTSDKLMDYLEGRFTEGMTRDNYGKWHLDHIRPLASFDFTGQDREEQLHIAWHHTNLQPLWAEDNHRKGAKYEEG